jgi:hypothetical protein
VDAWISAISGFIGVLVGTVVGAWTTVKVQDRTVSEERRRQAADIIGRLRKLLHSFTPSRFVNFSGEEPRYERWRLLESEWRDLTPGLLSLPVFYPNGKDLVERIYIGMNKLTNGAFHLERRTAQGIDSAHLEDNLAAQHSTLETDVEGLMQMVWSKKARRVDILTALFGQEPS